MYNKLVINVSMSLGIDCICIRPLCSTH